MEKILLSQKLYSYSIWSRLVQNRLLLKFCHTVSHPGHLDEKTSNRETRANKSPVTCLECNQQKIQTVIIHLRCKRDKKLRCKRA